MGDGLELRLSGDIGIAQTDLIDGFARPWRAAAGAYLEYRTRGGFEAHAAAAVDYHGVGFVTVRIGTWGRVRRKDGTTMTTSAGVSVLLTPLVDSPAAPFGGTG
jgi:hypothetical protein